MKVVVIGTGFGSYAVAPAYTALDCEVELVSPRDGEAVERAIAAPCDLVSIHSPPFLHLEHVRLATGHRRHVLCDKPFGRNPQEAREMLDLANEAGILHFLNFEFRCDPLRERLRELLLDGAIGEPLHLTDTMYLSRGRNTPHGWLHDRERGGGWIGAMASHQVDMLRWLFGEVEQASCQSRIDVQERPDSDGRPVACTAEDAYSAWLTMANGVTATLDCASSAAVDLPGQITIFGTEGVLQLQHMAELVLMKPGKEPERLALSAESNPVSGAQQRWLEKVCRAVAAREQIAPDFRDGLACAGVIQKMRE